VRDELILARVTSRESMPRNNVLPNAHGVSIRFQYVSLPLR